MNRAEIGVVLVNHRSAALVRARAEAMRDAGFAVVVVDNSGEHPLADGVPTVDAGANVGFGQGCNLGVAQLPGAVRVVCLHNPDVLVDPHIVEKLGDRVLRGAAIVAPALETPAGLRPYGYHYPSVAREAYVALRTARRVSAPRSESTTSGRGRAQRSRTRSVRRRFGSGALVAVDRSRFDALGGFDHRFFLYCEDLDLWHRAASRP